MICQCFSSSSEHAEYNERRNSLKSLNESELLVFSLILFNAFFRKEGTKGMENIGTKKSHNVNLSLYIILNTNEKCKCSGYKTKQLLMVRFPNYSRDLESVECSFIAITPRSTLIRSGSTFSVLSIDKI